MVFTKQSQQRWMEGGWKDMKELADNIDEIAERRDKVRTKVKEANAVTGAERNKQEIKKSKDD